MTCGGGIKSRRRICLNIKNKTVESIGGGCEGEKLIDDQCVARTCKTGKDKIDQYSSNNTTRQSRCCRPVTI